VGHKNERNTMSHTYFNLQEEALEAEPEAAEISQQSETDSLVLAISGFKNEIDNIPLQQEMTWADVRRRLSQHQERPTKIGAQAWSPTKYKPGATRKNGGVESISCAVLDIDNGTPLADVRGKLDGYAFLAHSSFSHTDEHPKYRIILPLNTPSPADNWPLHWARINHWLGNINDPTTKDQARIYFIPCHPPGSQPFVEVGQGKPLDIEELPELPEGLASTIKTAQSRTYSKVKIEGIEDPPADPPNPAEGLTRIVERCAFMQWASFPDHQNSVSNPLWMAMISNACRFEESEEWIHEASCKHDGYQEAKTDDLIRRCREHPAPITCAKIQSDGFTGCPEGGCHLPSGQGITRAPAGLWINPIRNQAICCSTHEPDCDDESEEDEFRVPGFRITNDQVIKLCVKNGEEHEVSVASHIDVTALTRDATGNNWGLLVNIKDPDGCFHEWAMPKEMLSSPAVWKAELLKMGADVRQGGGQDFLFEYFMAAKPTARALCVMQPGWYQNVFVLPNQVIGNTSTERVVFQTKDVAGADVFKPNGTLDTWKEEVGARCIGNSRLGLVVCAALTGPTLHLLGEENGGFHLVGGSSIGKTTAVEVAASIWGNRNKFVRNWRVTSNGVEGVAVKHNDTLLILDEISQVSAVEAGEIAYMLGNGRGKSRATINGTARPNAQWRLTFLSTGEKSLSETLQSVNRQIMAGQEVRLVNIPADAGTGSGLFEHIHDSPTAQQFATLLKNKTCECYGTAGPAWVEALADEENQAELLDAIRERMKNFKDNHVPSDASGQALRVGDRFALLAAVGEMATSLGILPWPEGEATNAARTCFDAWIVERNGTGNQEAEQAIRQVRHFLETNGESRFTRLDGFMEHNAIGNTINRAGFRKDTDDGRTEFYVLPEAYKQEVCGNLNPRDVTKALRDGGYLMLATDGGNQRQVRITGIGSTKLYVIKADLMGAAD
jgi:uncharacterized protein (DUF927 family)